MSRSSSTSAWARGGIERSPVSWRRAIEILRGEKDRLRLGAVLGYDGHATLDGATTYRRGVATQAMGFYRRHLAYQSLAAGVSFDPEQR